MDEVIKCYKRGYRQIGEGNTMKSTDDIDVWSDNRQNIVGTLLRWNEALTNAGLKINVVKSEILKVRRGEVEDFVVEIQGNKIKNVKYLGSIFSSKGNNKKIQNRQNSAKY